METFHLYIMFALQIYSTKMSFTKTFFDTVKPEATRMAICNAYNKNLKTGDSPLLLSTLTRWIRETSDSLTKRNVLNAISEVTGLSEEEILKAEVAA